MRGNSRVLKDVNKQHVKTLDAYWDGEYWEYKNPKTKNEKTVDIKIKDKDELIMIMRHKKEE